MNSVNSATTGNPFTRFMASGYGRLARIGLGLTIVAAGLLVAPWPIGLVIAGVGLIPIAAGVFNVCPVAPIWGGHFIGARYCPSNTQRQDR
ncbi:MAG: DUF2892 domain-containing protein [Anaerolineaceae bacterium]